MDYRMDKLQGCELVAHNTQANSLTRIQLTWPLFQTIDNTTWKMMANRIEAVARVTKAVPLKGGHFVLSFYKLALDDHPVRKSDTYTSLHS